MRVTVLGCAGTFPSPTSPCSAYLVEQDGFRLLLDTGTGSVGALQAYPGLLQVDAVLLSHLHADHCLDLVSWYYARRYHPSGLPPRLPVYGPAGTGERVRTVFHGSPPPELGEVYDFRVRAGGCCEIGPFRISRELVSHPVEAYATRLTAGGRSLCYSGDTGPADALVRVALDSDLALFEASWLDGRDHPPAVHLTAREAAEHATLAGVDRLLLTHLISAWGDEALSLEQASEAWAGPLDVARSGASIEV